MVPRLVPEILSQCAICDGAGAAAAGIGDSRSLMTCVRRSVEKIQRRWQTLQTREPAVEGSEQNTFGAHIDILRYTASAHMKLVLALT